MTAPLVTVAIPLYKSQPFFDIITENVENLAYENLEFIISDRHGYDDTLARLRQRFCTDRVSAF